MESQSEKYKVGTVIDQSTNDLIRFIEKERDEHAAKLGAQIEQLRSENREKDATISTLQSERLELRSKVDTLTLQVDQLQQKANEKVDKSK